MVKTSYKGPPSVNCEKLLTALDLVLYWLYQPVMCEMLVKCNEHILILSLCGHWLNGLVVLVFALFNDNPIGVHTDAVLFNNNRYYLRVVMSIRSLKGLKDQEMKKSQVFEMMYCNSKRFEIFKIL